MQNLRVIVFSSLYPSEAAPGAGLFIRERIVRLAARVPVTVVSPQAWSPFDWLIRLGRPHFRPTGARVESRDGLAVHRPRFLSMPGMLKRWDGWLMARCCLATVRRLARQQGTTLIDAHFLYPDGWAATEIGRRLDLPVAITLRGNKDQSLLGTDREPMLREALHRASVLIAVSGSLERDVALPLGAQAGQVSVIGNGVDTARFHPVDRIRARRELGLPEDAKVLIGVGNMIPLKGFQRVLPMLPALRRRFPGLRYLIVGGGATQGDLTPSLKRQAADLGVDDIVRFCGRLSPDALRVHYSASDVFALATEYEGWANVLLEAMACGLPVVTTRVGGNSQVVASDALGHLIDWWQPEAFEAALADALQRDWDREAIIDYARRNDWESRIDALQRVLEDAVTRHARAPAPRMSDSSLQP